MSLDLSTKVGFIGLGIMGEGMIRNLLKAGVPVAVWNRSTDKSAAVKAEHPSLVEVVDSPAAVVAAASITFSMLSNLEAAEAVFPSVLSAIAAGKSVVDCATLTPEAMQSMSEAVTAKGGRFLEAPVSGTKKPAADGTLIFLAAGDESLCKDATPYLTLMGKATHYYGASVGQGSKMKLVVNVTMGSMMAAVSEGIGMAEKSGLTCEEYMQVISEGAMACPMYTVKTANFKSREHPPAFPLKWSHKDMKFAIAAADKVGAKMPVAVAAEQQFENAKALGDSDFSSVSEQFRK